VQQELSVSHAHPSARRLALLSRLRGLSHAYAHHSADARYHIDNYYVDSQDLFGADFVENRYQI
jgi:hypothetical protein